jgi:hypothetical protein
VDAELVPRPVPLFRVGGRGGSMQHNADTWNRLARDLHLFTTINITPNKRTVNSK